MDFKAKGCGQTVEEMDDFRRGPWTVEEDLKLMDYIATHGEGRWNSLARCAGLKRTGKSCRLRWLNYLRPDVRRGNITPEEQLLILELHSRWGNRWSKIAQQLPGRTDNEIKNYWRTRVQKHAKQLKCDVNSKQFKDAIRYLWIPRLVERIQAAAAASANTASTTSSSANGSTDHQLINNFHEVGSGQMVFPDDFGGAQVTPSFTPENSSTASDSFGTQVSPVTSDMTDYYSIPVDNSTNPDYYQPVQVSYSESLLSPLGFYSNGLDFQSMEQNTWSDSTVGDASYNLWNVEDFWSLQHQINNSTL